MDEHELAERLSRGGRYRYLCPDVLRRISRRALSMRVSNTQAHHLARKKLHQIHGAFLHKTAYRDLERFVVSLEEGRSTNGICLDILGLHSSTRERIAIMNRCYTEIFASIGTIKSVLDLACGLHPFAMPWMGLKPETGYVSVEMDCRLVEWINRYLIAVGRKPAAVCADVLDFHPDTKQDLAILMKILPTLEQQKKGAGLKLLEQLNARRYLVSFPSRSLGGRRKSMIRGYSVLVEGIVMELGLSARRFDFPGEVFYLLERRYP